jgi:hypothetical protein
MQCHNIYSEDEVSNGGCRGWKSLWETPMCCRNKSDKILNANYAHLVQCHKTTSEKVAENKNNVKRGWQGVEKFLGNSNVMRRNKSDTNFNANYAHMVQYHKITSEKSSRK